MNKIEHEPVAYAVFAENGNIRIWKADPIQVETLRLEYGDQVRPLYTAPKLAEQQPDVSALVEALELIAESYDVGRHDGLSEECPALCATKSWLIAKDALALYRKGDQS